MKKNIEGIWENSDRSITFTKDEFKITFFNTCKVKAYRGHYTNNKNKIALYFEEYLDANNSWKSLDGTDLEGSIEEMIFNIDDDKIETFIINTNKTYEYQKKSVD